MSKRKQRKALAQWENGTRQWAHQAARDLVLSLVSGHPMPATPYRIGVVLSPGEHVWVECPVGFLQEKVPSVGLIMPPVRPWLVTSDRIVGRLGDDHLYGWPWEDMRGCRVGTSLSAEFVALDRYDGSRLDWSGPGIAPLAVAAVYKLHGREALLRHPGLGAVRLQGHRTPQTRPTPMALPSLRPSSSSRLAHGR
jgi:hypothetical protein